MRIAFAVNSNGLGHATRCIPIINQLIKEHDVYLISDFRALEYLKHEFKTRIKKYIKLPDYSFSNLIFTKRGFSLSRTYMLIPYYLKQLYNEHISFLKLHHNYKFNLIISDSRYGIYCKDIPSYLLLHHIKLPSRIKGTEIVSEFTNYVMLEKFNKLIIPDFKTDSISNELTHNFKLINIHKICYIGVLSMVKQQRVKQDIDYFFSISGPEPQRTQFEKKIFSNFKKLKKKNVVVALGKPEKRFMQKTGNITIYSYLDQKQQSKILNRAKVVISRSGFSTLSDISQLGKKALLIPTKGQPEQEYLAKYHLNKGNYYSVKLNALNIPQDLEIAAKYPGYKVKYPTRITVRKFMDIINKSIK